MRKVVFGVLITLVLSVAAPSWSLDQSKLMDTLVQKGLDSDQVGIIIQDESGNIFTLNESKRLKPASTMKILTAGAALENLGKDFHFKTNLSIDGAIKNHVLYGNVYMQAGGDPAFNTNSLRVYVNALRSEGIQSIRGNIVVDDSNFSDIHTLNMRSWSNVPDPGNYPLFVNVDPPANLQAGSRSWLKTKKRLRRLLELNEDYVIYQNMVEPDLWTAQDLVLLLRKSKIQITGKIVRGDVPDNTRIIETVTTPLVKVIHDMLKSSNNYYADMLIRNLAAQSGKKPANVEAGMEFIYSFLDHAGISHDDYSLNSGAGFSHKSYITAGALCAALNYLRSQPEIANVFFDSLPIAGTDGTLRYRMRRTEAQGNVHAKTGYLGSMVTRSKMRDGVVALAGFATSSAGKTLTFVMLYNGTRSPNVVRSTFDKICVQLVTDPEL